MSIIPLSSNPLIPLSASYGYDSIFSLKPIYHQHMESGYYGITNPLLNGISDVKAINNSLFFITSAVNLGNVIDDSIQEISSLDAVVYSSLRTNSGMYFRVVGTSIFGNETDSTTRSLFRFVRNNDGTYSILDINFRYWTINLDDPWEITLQNKIDTDTYNQQSFMLEFSGNKIYIKTNFKNIHYPPFLPEYYKRFIAVNTLTGKVGATGFVLDDKEDLRYTMTEFDDDGFMLGYDPDSIYVKYYNQLSYPVNNKNLEFRNIIRDTESSLLVDSPYKTSIDKTSGKIIINMANLKNIHTPEYEYASAPYIVGDSITQVTSANSKKAINRREYTRLFTGSNQDRGYENPYLGFNSNTKQFRFKTDTVTYFHYPKISPANIPIQTAGLIEAGAVPGNTPARSDKIWKKLANYEKNIWWGNSTHYGVSPTSSIYLPVQQGTWLCSWLSGSNSASVSGVWVDRWYYPGFATITDALTLDTSFFPNTGIVVWDEPTQMTLDGGCWYKYFHFGNQENLKIVDALNGVGDEDLRLFFDTWNSSTVEDESIYTNDGTLKGYNSNMVRNGILNLDGNNQYCMVPYSSSYKIGDNISVVASIKTEDWDIIKGNHIISNGINNGWNIQFTNGYFNPILVAFEKTYGHVVFLNNDGEIYHDTIYPISAHPVSGDFFGDPTAAAIDGDLTIWSTNNYENTKRLYKVNYDGTIKDEISFGSSVNLTEVSIDKNKNVWVLDTSTNTASGFRPDLSLYSTITMPSPCAINRIDFDVTNTFLSGDYTILDRCIDSENNIFELRLGETNIYKNNTKVYSSVGVTNIACDSNGRLWVLKNGNRVVKTAANSITEEASCSVGTLSTGRRRIIFTKEYSNGEYKDFAWVLQCNSNTLYKINSGCSVVKSINLANSIDITDLRFVGQRRALMSFDLNGDSTAYEWQTKYRSHVPRIEVVATLNEYLTGGLVLNYPASSLVDNEFYNFAFTYNRTNSVGKFYVNSSLVDQTSSTENNEIYYNYDRSMMVGGNMGTTTSFNELLDSTDYTFEGKLDSLRVYNTELNSSDIKHIEFLNYSFQDMLWNMPIGVQSFIEEIERFFKHKLPGSKSHFYNIRLVHLNITNAETRSIIEEIIRETVKRVAPVYTELYKVIWE